MADVVVAEVVVAAVSVDRAPRNRPTRPAVLAVVVVVVAVAVIGTAIALDFAQLRLAATARPMFWLMAGLTAVAGTRSFLASGRRGAPVVICPTLCFTFAILLCWGLAAATAAQVVAVAVVAVRLRHPATRAVAVAAQYTVCFAAAYLVLLAGNPDPFGEHGTGDMFVDALVVVAAAVAWLATQTLLTLALDRVAAPPGPLRTRRRAPVVGFQCFYCASLLMLSPILAVAAHVTFAFIPMIFLPLYAVERMARLSGERERATRHDPLTGLANRIGLHAHFDELAADPDRQLALLLLDLDRFKYVNDTLGHEVGDHLLKAVAARLSALVPDGGVVARLGGDEFAILTAQARTVHEARGSARELADRITEANATPVRFDDLQLDVTASIGIALYPADSRDFATLMRHADVAMYEAKRRGDTCVGYRPENDRNSQQRLSLLTELRHALDDRAGGGIALHYQPQVALATGAGVGVEALLRWRHPTRGMISTEEVLQVAEQTSAMHLITKRVIEDVTAQVRHWHAHGIRLRVSLNVSARDLYGGDIVRHLANQLAHHGVAPEHVQVEITESALMAEPAHAAATIGRIADLGVAVSLDDFGTGYSSLQHLRELPLAEIKIDKSFVAGMARHEDDAAIVASTIDLAHALGLRVVAEGVEDCRTWRLLADAGCDVVQGWHTARPMPGESVPGWLAAHARNALVAPR